MSNIPPPIPTHNSPELLTATSIKSNENVEALTKAGQAAIFMTMVFLVIFAAVLWASINYFAPRTFSLFKGREMRLSECTQIALLYYRYMGYILIAGGIVLVVLLKTKLSTMKSKVIALGMTLILLLGLAGFYILALFLPAFVFLFEWFRGNGM